MPKKTILAEYKGNKFTVENTWFSGAKLFHNGDLVASNNDIFAIRKDKPLMTTKVVIDGEERRVEVFAFAIFTVKLKITVDGIKIAGNDF